MTWLHNPYVAGALTGFVTAAAVDFHVFMKWTTWQEVTAFEWRIALFRWALGTVTGLLTSVGIVGLS